MSSSQNCCTGVGSAALEQTGAAHTPRSPAKVAEAMDRGTNRGRAGDIKAILSQLLNFAIICFLLRRSNALSGHNARRQEVSPLRTAAGKECRMKHLKASDKCAFLRGSRMAESVPGLGFQPASAASASAAAAGGCADHRRASRIAGTNNSATNWWPRSFGCMPSSSIPSRVVLCPAAKPEYAAQTSTSGTFISAARERSASL